VDLEKMLFEQAQVLSQSINGNLSDDIAKERDTA
jgi:hypothetical protein